MSDYQQHKNRRNILINPDCTQTKYHSSPWHLFDDMIVTKEKQQKLLYANTDHNLRHYGMHQSGSVLSTGAPQNCSSKYFKLDPKKGSHEIL